MESTFWQKREIRNQQIMSGIFPHVLWEVKIGKRAKSYRLDSASHSGESEWKLDWSEGLNHRALCREQVSGRQTNEYKDTEPGLSFLCFQDNKRPRHSLFSNRGEDVLKAGPGPLSWV